MNPAFAHAVAVMVLDGVALGFIIWVCATDVKQWESNKGTLSERQGGAIFKRVVIIVLSTLFTLTSMMLP